MGSISSFAVDIDGTLTENGGGRLYIPAMEALRYLERLGYNIIYVTGRSSIEAYVLAVFIGTTKIAVGENGGAVTTAPQEHVLLASKKKCLSGYEVLKKNIDGVKIKPVFERMTEVVLFRTFDIEQGRKILKENNLDLSINDSKYAFHINEKGIDKAIGLKVALKMLKAHAAQTVAIGDSETDIPMFDICGYSVALNHAPENVKSRANHVVRGTEGIGVVDAIDFVAFNYMGLRSKNDISSLSE
ncbi:MAG: phosphoglycolate phosphatase [Nitrososphaeraceae archaeon]|nr:phosphoglycolate phosphatase [Nitrososphaeraceae archaeon]